MRGIGLSPTPLSFTLLILEHRLSIILGITLGFYDLCLTRPYRRSLLTQPGTELSTQQATEIKPTIGHLINKQLFIVIIAPPSYWMGYCDIRAQMVMPRLCDGDAGKSTG